MTASTQRTLQSSVCESRPVLGAGSEDQTSFSDDQVGFEFAGVTRRSTSTHPSASVSARPSTVHSSSSCASSIDRVPLDADHEVCSTRDPSVVRVDAVLDSRRLAVDRNEDEAFEREPRCGRVEPAELRAPIAWALPQDRSEGLTSRHRRPISFDAS
jgi:hypothetical protein